VKSLWRRQRVKRPVLRSCIGCRAIAQKAALARFTVLGGEAVLDRRQQAPGRGAYLCWSEACLRSAINRKRFEKTLRNRLSEQGEQEFIEALRARLSAAKASAGEEGGVT
jgi:hypothetical protein